jgi:MFS family permease
VSDSRDLAPIRGVLPWLMWGLGALFYCYGFFQRVAPGVMVAELMRDFAVGATITGIMSSLYFYAYASLQIPIGLMLDRFGPRRMLAVSALLAALGSLSFALAESLTPAYLGRALIGIGSAVSWVGALKLASMWFPPRRFALLTGLTMASGMAGAVGGQVPLGLSVAAFGWRGTMTGAAILAGFLAFAFYLVVRDRVPGAPPPPSPKSDEGAKLWSGVALALKEPQTLLTGLFGCMLVGPLLTFAGLWGVPFMMTRYDLARPDAAFAISIILVGWGVGSPIFGWLSDHIHRRRAPMLVAASLSLVITLVWLYVPGLPLGLVYVLFLAMGLLGGGMVMTFAAAREHNPIWAAGATLGIVNMMVMGNGAIFQSLTGWLLDLGWGGELQNGARVYSVEAWMTALLVMPFCQIVSLTAAFFVRETFCTPQK